MGSPRGKIGFSAHCMPGHLRFARQVGAGGTGLHGVWSISQKRVVFDKNHQVRFFDGSARESRTFDVLFQKKTIFELRM